MLKKILYFSVILILLFINCSRTQYKDPSEDKGSREWGAKEIKMTVNKLVHSLYEHLKVYKIDAYIQVKKIRNRTAEHIDTKLLADEVVSNLIKKRIKFIDRTYTDDAIEEMKRGMTGLIDPERAISAGKLVSPNFYLHGEISESKNHPKGKMKQYLVVTLKLTNLETNILEWQDKQEFFKITRTRYIAP